MKEREYDLAVIGGGLFGCYAALFLAGKGKRVILIEKEKDLLRKASLVNQARLHAGYHYPRSVATALMSDDHKERFASEHRAFVNSDFEQYYAIDRHASFTDPIQFERFCDHIGLEYQRVQRHDHFNFDRLEALYLTREETFDPVLIGGYYRQQITANQQIDTRISTYISQVIAMDDHWQVQLISEQSTTAELIRTTQVINATYAGSNAVNQLFGVSQLELLYEISEIALVTSPQIKNLGLTVMDGPFASLMPYGYSGLLSLSSVAYTHHKVSHHRLPTFDCQSKHPDCRPEYTANCTDCNLHPASNYHKMLRQIAMYFQPEVEFRYFSSLYTIKSKLKANHIDDGRLTEISILRENPRFYCIFAGKINSIYEIEKVIRL